MNVIPSLNVTADALNAERVRLDVVAQNIANAQTTRDVNGQVYQRKVVSFESVMDEASRAAQGGEFSNNNPLKTVRVAKVGSDTTTGELIYNPGHPHADAKGMVRMPNVEVAREMVDLISSSRAYEANLTVAKNSKSMADAALRIGRQ